MSKENLRMVIPVDPIYRRGASVYQFLLTIKSRVFKMAKKTIIANWKSNLNTKSITEWLHKVGPRAYTYQKNLNTVIAPPAIYISHISNLIKTHNYTINICAQDVSQFNSGSYTGEVNATQYAEFVKYALIGHSERKVNFRETNSIVAEKVNQALRAGITPIICVSDKVDSEGLIRSDENPLNETNFRKQIIDVIDKIDKGNIPKLTIMYEPKSAISKKVGNTTIKSPEKILTINVMIAKIKEILPQNKFYYGGSINKDIIYEYLNSSYIDGVVVGGSSLIAEDFISLYQNAYKS